MAIPNLLIEFEKFKHTREGFVQMILASQLIGERPMEWNTPYPLGAFGADLLRAIYASQFHLDLPVAEAQVYWEFKLPLQNSEETRWPDLAVRTQRRLILFELKTEAGSIREGQVDEHLMLGRHHFPDHDVDMIYITTDSIDGKPAADPRSHYCNVTWATIAALERKIPESAVSGERVVLALICEYLDELQGITTRHRMRKRSRPKEVTPPLARSASESVLAQAPPAVDEQGQIDFEAILQIFHEVESTGKPQALDLPCESPNDAYRLVDEIEKRIRTSNQHAAAPILRTRGWVWTPKSKGEAMTESGRIHHVEIRVSRYEKVQRPLA